MFVYYQAMLDWSDLKYVLETVRQGGLSGAARVLRVNHATVSRRIGSIESALGVRLFDRLPNGYLPTSAGCDAAKTAELVEAACLDLERRVASRDEKLRGNVTLTVPQLLLQVVMAPILRDFCKIYPDIRLSIVSTNEVLSLSRGEADVAIRVSNDPPASLFGGRVSGQKACVYASRDYLSVLQETQDATLDIVEFSNWATRPGEIDAAWPGARCVMELDDMASAQSLVSSGVGATRMPCFIGDSNPDLVRIPRIPLLDYAPVWVLTHPDLKRVRRVRVFMEFVSEKLRGQTDLFEGQRPDIDA